MTQFRNSKIEIKENKHDLYYKIKNNREKFKQELIVQEDIVS